MSNLADLATGTVKISPSPNISGTELTLQNGEGDLFPLEDFYVTAQRDEVIANRYSAEILHVVSRDGDTLTIERAQKDTTPKSIIVGWRITLSLYSDEIEARTDKHYQQDFTNVSSVTVTHNFGKRPAVSVVDSSHREVFGEIQHQDNNSLVVSFSTSFSGTVICN